MENVGEGKHLDIQFQFHISDHMSIKDIFILALNKIDTLLKGISLEIH